MGAMLTNDFIELFNRGTSPVDVTGWSIQYASPSGVSWDRTLLNGTIQPGQYYLVQEARGNGGTVTLPPPDAAGGINLSAAAGKVALVSDSTLLSGSRPGGADIVDFVGYGNANGAESSPAPELTNTTADLRSSGGCTDTDNNAADFVTSSPNPRNTSSQFNACAAVSGGTAQDTLVHIADGDQWTTTFTLVNLDNVQASYTLSFYADDGSPLAVGIGGAGTVTAVSGTLFVNGSTILQTTGRSGLRQGWAHLDTNQSMGAQAIFKSHVAGRADYEAAVPAAYGCLDFVIVFDNSAGYFTGVAIANTLDSGASVRATFRDQQGVQLGNGTLTLQPFGHVALLLNQSYPLTAGVKGTAAFSSDSCIAGLGLRFNPTGPFTSTTAF